MSTVVLYLTSHYISCSSLDIRVKSSGCLLTTILHFLAQTKLASQGFRPTPAMDIDRKQTGYIGYFSFYKGDHVDGSHLLCSQLLPISLLVIAVLVVILCIYI